MLGFRSRRLPISALLFKMLLFRLFLLLWRTSVAFTFKISYTRKKRTPINDYIHQSAGCHSAPTVFTVYQRKEKVSADLMIFCVLRGNSSSYFLNNKINNKIANITADNVGEICPQKVMKLAYKTQTNLFVSSTC